MDNKKKLETEEDYQEENIYSNFNENKENPFNNNQNMSNNVGTYEYREKEYKTNTLQEHTQITRASKASRFLLFGFYALVIVIGAMAVFMIRANKYEFYLKQDEVVINVGSSYQVELIPKDIRYFDYLKYDYSIADESIATVDEYGTITTKSPGRTTLKISLKPGFTSKVVQIVSTGENVENLDIGVYKNDKYEKTDEIDLNTNQSVTIKGIINNESNINTSASFKSSDENIAVVDDFGNVTAKGEGETVITGTLDGVKSEVVVVVGKDKTTTTDPGKDTPATKVTKIDLGVSSQITKYVNDSVQLSPMVEPSSLKNYTIKWTSSNTSIATVNNGLIKCIKAGTATITAEADGVKATVKVVVENAPSTKVKVTKINLGIGANVTKYVGDSLKVTPTVEPSNAKNYTIKWTSSNTSVATVSNGLVKFLKAGTTVITAEVDGVKASSTITVKSKGSQETTPPKDTTKVKVTKINLGIASQTTKYVGENLQLSPTVEPSNAKNYTIKWSSSNTSVATVSNGLIKCIKAGTAVITAEVDGVKATSTIVVKAKETTPKETTTVPKGSQFSASQVKISNTELTINKGKSATFTITVTKAVGTLRVTTSNASVAKLILPTSTDSDIPVCKDNDCFFDGLQKGDTLTFTVNGASAGTAYINVSNYELFATDDAGTEVKGSGKVGILVK